MPWCASLIKILFLSASAVQCWLLEAAADFRGLLLLFIVLHGGEEILCAHLAAHAWKKIPEGLLARQETLQC